MTQQTAQSVAVQDENTPAALLAGFERMRPQFAVSLPSHISAERFERVAITAVNLNPMLLEADRRSFFNALAKAAQDGLMPDGREAALVIFNTKVKRDGKDVWINAVQYMPMIGGIVKKVRQSGEVTEFRSRIVYAKDRFKFFQGDDERIEHEPYDGPDDRGPIVKVYAIAKGKDGWIEREVMTRADVERVRAVSKSKDSGPWVTWWDEQARKTVMRRLSKRLPVSPEIHDVFARDDDLQPSDPPPPRPTRAQIAQVSPPVPEATDDEAAAANRQLDREAGRIINGTVETDEDGAVDPETGDVTEKPKATEPRNPILPPVRPDGNWTAWRNDCLDLIEKMPGQAMPEVEGELGSRADLASIPNVTHAAIMKAIRGRK